MGTAAVVWRKLAQNGNRDRDPRDEIFLKAEFLLDFLEI